jgi:hypothetical protein
MHGLLLLLLRHCCCSCGNQAAFKLLLAGL